MSPACELLALAERSGLLVTLDDDGEHLWVEPAETLPIEVGHRWAALAKPRLGEIVGVLRVRAANNAMPKRGIA